MNNQNDIYISKLDKLYKKCLNDLIYKKNTSEEELIFLNDTISQVDKIIIGFEKESLNNGQKI